ncbi:MULTISPECIES: phosphonopyruvate decarboxylase [unclassified Schaalia]|uniref:phosphonopyruvate decarboxylase n=1 Tax=unclassified Schaalia TaxID=2691889 RepID=UPI001E5FCD53|nr:MULTISPECIES: phosphonopyruvate decarboxylase [unclassified Schaalia]MCD4550327.1 phosphonopyruvate decarboxylase [Schaalia sp. lx-260]MCD4557767.1 phosphonopyruvate decarboxylase [Schaalia sp. lx-100]
MQVESFVNALGADFYTGVPDSQLKALCNYLMHTYGTDPAHHVIAANEGNCVALAAGYHLATGKVPVVYMQNSGQGNVINPVASLLHEKVYAIPMIFVLGWRGEPGVHDEPQHVYQGEVTLKLLDDMGIRYCIVGKDTTPDELHATMREFRSLLDQGLDVAFVVRKGALSFTGKVEYANNYPMNREEIIRHIVEVTGDDPIVSTTGKASRELFEIREARGQGHERDFLTVGSMGHASSIALGMALAKPQQRLWCIDGDGATLMHMGSLALIGAQKPRHLIHIVINNEAHETVGGMPTVAGHIDLVGIARSCGYEYVASAATYEQLDTELKKACEVSGPVFVEVRCNIGAREDLGRPTTTARENKENFMSYVATLN